MQRFRSWMMAAAFALLGALVTPLSAQTGSIEGRVTDQATGNPLAGVSVQLVGTDQVARTATDGRYRLTNVAIGSVTLRFTTVGYEPQRVVTSVAGGAPTTVDAVLTQAIVRLDELVVTATGERRKREVANDIASIDASKAVDEGAITSMSDLLSSRASGVVVTNGSGSPGTATRIRIRGSSSLSLSNEPLLYVDGVRIDNTQDALTVGTGGQTISRLSDLNPEEIESIEIVKGPSAATLYGTEAANGVILVTTKRGRAGPARWNAWAESGIITDPNTYPANFDQLDAAGASCLNIVAAGGGCTQDGELLSFNPLEDTKTTPIATGNRMQYGTSVAGGTERINYFLSGEWERELGTFRLPDSTQTRLITERGPKLPQNLIRPNLTQRVNLRANVGAQVLQSANLQVSLGYVNSRIRLPQNDNNSLGMIPSAFLGGAEPDNGWGFFTPDQVFAILTQSTVDRFTGSLQGTWTPATWLTTRGAFGVDVTGQFDENFFPTGEVPSGTAIDGTRNSNRLKVYQWTVDYSATANTRLTDRVTSQTTAGLQYFKNRSEATFAFGNRIPAGVQSLAGAVITNAGEATAENITLGFYGEQQFSLNDRLFVTGGLRIDNNNAFGQQFDLIVYPRGSVSWVVSEEPFFPRVGALSSLRLRGAWGATGRQPQVNAATPFLNPIAVTDGGEDVVGVTVGNIGNPDLKPERSQELELGIDSDWFDGRVTLDATYYDSRTKDQIVNRVLPPSLGSSATQFVNLAEVSNKGLEGTLDLQVLQRTNVNWNLSFTGTINSNKVIDLGEGVEPIIFGLGGNAQRHEAGFPAGAYFQEPILSFEDANGDGLISTSEVTVGDTAAFLGQPQPKRELSIQSAVTLFDRIRLSALMDHRGGHKLQNATAFFRCAQFFNCESSNVAGADLEQQAATAAYIKTGSRAGFVENASFWKLREVALTFFAPDSWTRALANVDRLSFTITGRNLLTITDYRGVDPEVITASGANFSTADFLTQPPVRYWTARLNVGF